MKRHPILILLVLLVVGIGGNVAWRAYEDHQRSEAWRGLLGGKDCAACAARKAGIAEKAKKRRAEKEALANGQSVMTEQSLIQTLESEPPMDLTGHAEPVETATPIVTE